MKPGYLTTEFWLTIVALTLTNAGTLDVPDKYRWIVSLGVIVGYAISRGLAKYESPPEPVTPPSLVSPFEAEFAEQTRATAALKTAQKPAAKAPRRRKS